MAIRLIVGINAAPGKGSELAKLYKARCAEISTEPGCQQFEVFQSVVNPDKLAILERWAATTQSGDVGFEPGKISRPVSARR